MLNIPCNKIKCFNLKISLLRSMRLLSPILVILSVLSCNTEKNTNWSSDQYRKAATALFQQGLYQDAITTFQEYLHSGIAPDEDVPKVLYQMGNIYLENLRDPQNALAQYTILKTIYPEATFNNQLGKKIVMALEQAGRSGDAKSALSEIVNIDPQQKKEFEPNTNQEGSKVVARVDGRDVTLNEVRQAFGGLPESSGDILNMVRQYVATNLIARASERKGFGDRAEIKLRLAGLRDQVLAQAMLTEELKIPNPSPNDLKYYFEANAARYKTQDSSVTFENSEEKVRADWAREKQAEAYSHYVEQQLQSAQVRFFDVTGATK